MPQKDMTQGEGEGSMGVENEGDMKEDAGDIDTPF
jgi:hypothetical protein